MKSDVIKEFFVVYNTKRYSVTWKAKADGSEMETHCWQNFGKQKRMFVKKEILLNEKQVRYELERLDERLD